MHAHPAVVALSLSLYVSLLISLLFSFFFLSECSQDHLLVGGWVRWGKRDVYGTCLPLLPSPSLPPPPLGR